MPPLRSTGESPESGVPEYAGRYRLENCLGTGGMGVVRLATSGSGLRLAVKVIHAEHASDPEFRARFRQEVGAARRVSGAFTASVVDADPEAERPWMATLFIEGPTLAERVKRYGPLEPGELRRMGAGLAEALRDIHRAGVVHRDLKPSNVLLAPDGPKVIDFGISRPADSDLRTETGKLIGTPPFMAPEQFQRPREVGPAADVFAMGAVLVHALTGRGPFDSDSPYIVAYQVVHDEPDLTGVPEDLVPLVRGCLAKEPADRPTPYEVMVALRGSSPSASYDTMTHIPGPRTPDPREKAPRVPAVAEVVPLRRRGVPGDGVLGGAPVFPDGAGDRGGASGGADSGPGAQSDTDTESGADGGRGSGGRPAADGLRGDGRWRARLAGRRRWAVAGAAVLALGAVGVTAVNVYGGGAPARTPGPHSPAGGRTEPAPVTGRAPAGWVTPLGGAAAGDRAPACAADPLLTGLFCSAPGIKAARIDPATGDRVWVRKADRRSAQNGHPGAPVHAGGLVHVVDSWARRLEALDPVTGEVRWAAATAAYSAVRHIGDTVLLVADGGRVRALDAATGARRWEARRGGAGTEWVGAVAAGPGTRTGGGSGTAGRLPPALAVTPSADGAATLVTAVAPEDGRRLWQRRQPGTLRPVGVSGGALFLLRVGRDGFADAVVRLGLTNAREPRTVPLSAPVDQAQAVAYGDVVYLSGAGGSLTAVRTAAAGAGPDAGPRELWRLETAVVNLSRPAGDGRAVYVTAGDGRLLAVDAVRGALTGQTGPRMEDGRYTYASFLPAPVAAGGRVFGAAPDGSVFAVDAAAPANW
jgi:outer membrane protein assembly factor BamB